MDTYRAFLAILLSMLILLGWQRFFAPSPPLPAPGEQQQAHQEAARPSQSEAAAPVQPIPPPVAADPAARTITAETPLYKAVFFEQGGGLKSFVLKSYRTTRDKDAPPVELVTSSSPADLPMAFSLDGTLPLFKADTESLNLTQDGALTMRANLTNGISIERKLIFHAGSYLIGSADTVTNRTAAALQMQPAVSMTNAPFHAGSAGSSLFSGPAVYADRQLHEIPLKNLSNGLLSFQGAISWAAYMDNYFMLALLPKDGGAVSISAAGENNVRTMLNGGMMRLAPGASATFQHDAYFGPKKMAYLKQIGHDLDEAINLGWFGVLAKPMLMLLNFLYKIFGNYGIAIILLTCLVKGAFWPVTHKGMKSMKNLQKLQPKMAKLREQFKDDPARMNQEVMALYKAYKVNPLGGCLPMLIQIPFFFALYRVLMAAIELRHAPFMLWINDLSAPDRLMIGFDVPWLHGIPVLTLLMGGTMFLQQKMTPTTADPQQAKMMQMMPIMFTVMFVNFASGLVLYWFVSNLLSILQQQLINRQTVRPHRTEDTV